MGEQHQDAGLCGVLEQPDDFCQAIAALRCLGADRFDPIGLHYLEALARRAQSQDRNVKRILEVKLKNALNDFGQRFQKALGDAQDAIALAAATYPHAAAGLQQLFQAGDLKGVRQLIATLGRSGQHESLSSLTLRMEQHAQKHADRTSQSSVGSPVELRSVRQFRNTWSKLSATRQVARALDKGPKNAGPINSHMLVLRSLALMRDISPDYLNRFVSYVDTLLCLDRGDRETAPGVTVHGEGMAKRKSPGRRGMAR